MQSSLAKVQLSKVRVPLLSFADALSHDHISSVHVLVSFTARKSETAQFEGRNGYRTKNMSCTYANYTITLLSLTSKY